jgi:hypothetical protein
MISIEVGGNKVDDPRESEYYTVSHGDGHDVDVEDVRAEAHRALDKCIDALKLKVRAVEPVVVAYCDCDQPTPQFEDNCLVCWHKSPPQTPRRETFLGGIDVNRSES